MKEYYLDGDVKIFYKKNNFKKNRKTLVFVHGITGSSAAWIPFERILEKKYNVLSFDIRGHGKSYKPKKYEDYSIPKFAEDLERLVTHEKIKKFVLVCHSLGVFIGLEFLRKNQKLVESAVFMSPAAKPPVNFASKILKLFLSLNSVLNILPIKKDYGSHVDYSRHVNTGDWNIKRMIADVTTSPGLKVYLWATKNTFNFDAEDFLKKIKIPVLLIHGKKDTIFPFINSVEMSKKIKNSKLVLWKDIDHIIVLNKPREASEEIEKFISE